ncbi:MAG: hypothetical protein L0Z62_32560 [Gemmataceae bacterium]|nr:hypothetical protein [Gemmataceae bacterium]
MITKGRVVAVLIGAIAACPWNSTCPMLLAQDSNSLLERFRKEGPLAWQQYLTRAKRLQGTFKDVAVELAPTKATLREVHCEFKQRPGCSLFMYQRVISSNLKAAGVGGLDAYNTRYAFTLRRGKPDAPWAVTDLQMDLGKMVSIAPGITPASPQYFLNFPIYNSYVEGANLPELIAHPQFKPTKATAVTRGGRPLVKIDFTFGQPTSKKPAVLQGGWWLLDPDFLWVQRESQILLLWRRGANKEPGKLTVTTTIDYQEHAAPFPILKRRVEHRKQINPQPGESEVHEWTYTFDLAEADLPESAFTLSAFGIKEPRGMPPVGGGSRWYLWFIAFAILSLAMGWLFRWRVQRRKLETA